MPILRRANPKLKSMGTLCSKEKIIFGKETAENFYEVESNKVLQEQVNSLLLLVAQLEKDYECVENEDNEFKTRYENQVQINKHQEIYINELEKRCGTLKEDFKRLQDGKNTNNESSETDFKKAVKDLKREKTALESQLSDLEWRLDQEAKGFYQTDEKRKDLKSNLNRKDNKIVDKHLKEIEKIRDKKLKSLEKYSRRKGKKTVMAKPRPRMATNDTVEHHNTASNNNTQISINKRSRVIPSREENKVSELLRKSDKSRKSLNNLNQHKKPSHIPMKSKFKSLPKQLDDRGKSFEEEEPIRRNISPTKRVLDPKMGPIKKTAAVRKLPKIQK